MKRIILSVICAAITLAASAQSQRECINFDDSWQFAFGDASSPAKDFGCGTEYFNYLTKAASIHNEGPYSPKFDASGWAIVDLPHDWVVDLPYAAEASHSHGYKELNHRDRSKAEYVCNGGNSRTVFQVNVQKITVNALAVIFTYQINGW